ncbi:MAG: ribosome biogenesis GTP-binding protein YihA/YsxC [Paludibacteraceae bacterium]|nr:ribosome biogenesis GTP-binding protein YihA/YsxC [Paludibacteraceae bacterium]
MITSSEFVISSPDVTLCPKSDLPEYAFIGRSNVGKSSLINMLCHDPHLAKTSQKPGKTLLINHFLIHSLVTADNKTRTEQNWHLVDLPGYGFAQTGQQQREELRRMIERYCLGREELINLFVLVDCRLAPQKIDLEFMEWLGENEVPFSIVFTKADKVGKGRLSENVGNYKLKLKENWEELPPIFLTSAETNMGRDELTEYIETINASLK